MSRPSTLKNASGNFWERAHCAMSVMNYDKTQWARDCGLSDGYILSHHSRSKMPPDEAIAVLIRETGCTMAYLMNPAPIDLSK